MKFPWQNPQNPNVTPGKFQLSPSHKPAERVAIVIFSILAFPFMLVLYPIGRLLWGAAKHAMILGFYLGERCFKPANNEDRYRGQWIRAWLNNEAANTPHINFNFRKFLYRLSGISIGKSGFIGMGGILEDLHPENVVIEDNVIMSFGVTIVGHGPRRGLSTPAEKMVIFRHHAYVGARSTFVPGIEIGHHATIGAGAVVTKSVPPGAVVAGCPARILYYKKGFEPTES